jgi:hypothetical protein
MMLVTLEEASFHLRRDTSDDDQDLTLKIRAASAVVRNYLKSDTAPYETTEDSNGDPVIVYDSNGDAVVKDEVKAATLLMVGEFYKNREGSGNYRPGFIPDPVMAILYPLRDPAVR